MRIKRREIGHGAPVYIIAEMSANHGQDFERAVAIVKAAKAAGADAVKLQTYTADTMTLRSQAKPFQISGGTLWDGQTLHDLYSKAFTPWEWQPKLKRLADDLGIDLFSSAFDATSVDFLEQMNVPAYKVASLEISDIPLIKKIAATGKPIILSTGTAKLPEINEAVAAAKEAGNTQIALLKCTSAYPAPPEEMNLLSIPDMMERFRCPIGLSDHSLGAAVAITAVALGACIVEKHFTLSRSLPSEDSAFSMEPEEFRLLVESIRMAEKALGQVAYGPSKHESAIRAFRRSLFIAEDIKEGESFTDKNVRSIRPGDGLEPKYWEEIRGKKASRDLVSGKPLSWDDVAVQKEKKVNRGR